MNRVIWLPPDQPKCEATACSARPCALRDVSVNGRALVDLSIGVWGNKPVCEGPKWPRRILPSAAVKPAAARIVKEYVKGL